MLIVGTPGIYAAGVFGTDGLRRSAALFVWIPLILTAGLVVCHEVIVNGSERTITCRAPLRSATADLGDWTAVRYRGSTAELQIGKRFVVFDGNSKEFAHLLSAARAAGAQPRLIPPSGPRRMRPSRGMKVYSEELLPPGADSTA